MTEDGCGSKVVAIVLSLATRERSRKESRHRSPHGEWSDMRRFRWDEDQRLVIIGSPARRIEWGLFKNIEKSVNSSDIR